MKPRGADAAIRVRGEMRQKLEDHFNVLDRADGPGDFFGGAFFAFPSRQLGNHLVLHGHDFDRRLFTGLDARLMIGVDTDERGIQSDGAFVEGDQRPNALG